MAAYTVTLNETEEKLLSHLMEVTGVASVGKEFFIQNFFSKRLREHSETIKDRSMDMLVTLSDEDFAALGSRRAAEIESRRVAAAEKDAEEAKARELANAKDTVQPTDP